MLQDVSLDNLIGHDLLNRSGIRFVLDSRVKDSEHMFYLICMDHVRTVKDTGEQIVQSATHPADCHRCAIDL